MAIDSRIYVNVHGGLGNQLFVYAAGRNLADLLNCDLVFDVSSFFIKNNAKRGTYPPSTPRIRPKSFSSSFRGNSGIYLQMITGS